MNGRLPSAETETDCPGRFERPDNEPQKNMLAITHVPSPHIDRCQLSYVGRASIQYDRAVQQHEQYCRMLRQRGIEVHTLDVNREFPDCAFVEDTAIVLDEVALLASMGTESRRGEPAGIESELRRYREVRRIELPATIEGGDVLAVDRTLLVGLSSRTNQAGVDAVESVVGPYGYRVMPVRVHGCLHLKTACTWLDDRTLLVNPEWVDTEVLSEFELLCVPKDEPWAANVTRIGRSLWISAHHIRTASMIREMGFDVEAVDISEFAKAEGGVTCLSIILQTVL